MRIIAKTIPLKTMIPILFHFHFPLDCSGLRGPNSASGVCLLPEGGQVGRRRWMGGGKGEN